MNYQRAESQRGSGRTVANSSRQRKVSAPDRENVFVFEVIFQMIVMADLAYAVMQAKSPQPPQQQDDDARSESQSSNDLSNDSSNKVLSLDSTGSNTGSEKHPSDDSHNSKNNHSDNNTDTEPKVVPTETEIETETEAQRNKRWADALAELFSYAPDSCYTAPAQRRYVLKPEWVLYIEETDTCVFVAEDRRDDCYIVSFRGTVSLGNMLDDLKMNLVPFVHNERFRQVQ